MEGNRSVTRDVDFFLLDAILAVGYRVNSSEAIQFRIWATKTLKEFEKYRVIQDHEYESDFDKAVKKLSESKSEN